MSEFLLGYLAGIVQCIVLVTLVLLWWLSREARPTERLTRAEREFLTIVKGARR